MPNSARAIVLLAILPIGLSGFAGASKPAAISSLSTVS